MVFMKPKQNKIIHSIILAVLLPALVFPFSTWAMTSTNYQVTDDSVGPIHFQQTSTNYTIDGSVEFMAGKETSTNYKVEVGSPLKEGAAASEEEEETPVTAAGGSGGANKYIHSKPGPRPIIIGNGLAYTNSRFVTIYLDSGDTAEMNLNFNQDEFSDNNWIPYVSQISRDLGPTDGLKKFLVKFKSVHDFETYPYGAYVTLDTLAPKAPVVKYPAINEKINLSQPEFFGTAEPNIKLSLKIGQRLYLIETGADGSWSLKITPDLPLGDYLLEVRAEDWAGNASETVAVPFSILKKKAIIPPKPGEEYLPPEEKPKEYILITPEELPGDFWYKKQITYAVRESLWQKILRQIKTNVQLAIRQANQDLAFGAKKADQGLKSLTEETHARRKNIAFGFKKTIQEAVSGGKVAGKGIAISFKKFSQGIQSVAKQVNQSLMSTTQTTGQLARQDRQRIKETVQGGVFAGKMASKSFITGIKKLGQRVRSIARQINQGLMSATRTTGQLARQGRQKVKTIIAPPLQTATDALQQNMTFRKLAQVTGTVASPFKKISQKTKLVLVKNLQKTRQIIAFGAKKTGQAVKVGAVATSKAIAFVGKKVGQNITLGIKKTAQGVAFGGKVAGKGIVFGAKKTGRDLALSGRVVGRSVTLSVKKMTQGIASGGKAMSRAIAFVAQRINQELMLATQTSGRLAQQTRADLISKLRNIIPPKAPPPSELVQQKEVKPEEIPTFIPKEMPQDIVIVKTRKGNLDLAWAGQLNLAAGMNFYSFIRPSVKPKKVIGRLIFSQTLSQSQKQAAEDGWELIKPAEAAEAQAMDWQVAEVEYKELGQNNIYVAEVNVPQVAGHYTFQTEVQLFEGGSRLYDLSAKVNERGYVYEEMERGIEGRLEKVAVTLYSFNPQTNQFEIWPAQLYDQVNPQITQKDGEYFFLVPAGKYYITAQKNSYEDYKSDIITLGQSGPIMIPEKNIKMKFNEKNWWRVFN